MTRRRDDRGPNDERDERDSRRVDDPRDGRDPRLPGDPVDAATRVDRDVEAAAVAHGVRHPGRWLALIIAVGLAAVSFTAWQVSALRHREDRRLCERIVAVRDDSRSVWLLLVGRNPDSFAGVVSVVELTAFLDERLPQLVCKNNVPTPVEEA